MEKFWGKVSCKRRRKKKFECEKRKREDVLGCRWGKEVEEEEAVYVSKKG